MRPLHLYIEIGEYAIANFLDYQIPITHLAGMPPLMSISIETGKKPFYLLHTFQRIYYALFL